MGVCVCVFENNKAHFNSVQLESCSQTGAEKIMKHRVKNSLPIKEFMSENSIKPMFGFYGINNII